MNKIDPPVSLIIINARIYDPLKGILPATAVAVSRNRITLLGKDDQLLDLRQQNTQVINAEKSILIPSFSDSHIHFIGYVKRQQEIRLNNCHSLTEVLDLIRQRVEMTPEGEWITGGGWNRNLWKEDDYPHYQLLDDISTRHYIALDSKDWHTTWVNTPVLQMAGIPLDRPYPNAMHIAVHPKTRRFTGLLEENIRLKVYNLIPKVTYKAIRKGFQQTVNEFYRLGISAIHSVETLDEFSIYQEAKSLGELGLRTFWYYPIQQMPVVKDLLNEQGLGDHFLRITGTKMFVDGSFGSQTAELLENYQGLDHAGVGVMSEEELDENIRLSVTAGFSCAVHAIGDQAVQKTLGIYGKYADQTRKLGLRHRIEHAQLIHPNDLCLFKRYRVFPSVQPIHLASDISLINRYLGDRARFAYPYNSLKRAGAELLFGSDAPVESFNPWCAIYEALERKLNLDPTEPTFYPDEKLDLRTCLKAYTYNPMKVVELGTKFGRIEEGMSADFFLIDKDIFQADVEELPNVKSKLTVVAGKVVFQAVW
jgi:predicted amidohydrolase YtcJ